MSIRNTWRRTVAVVAIATASCFTSNTHAEETITTGDGLLSLTANMPVEVRMGEQFTYSVKVTNASNNVTLHNIELKQLKAEGFSVDSTTSDAKGSPSKNDIQTKDKNDSEDKGQVSKGQVTKGQVNKGNISGQMMIAMLKPGESKTINVTASADEEGELRSCLAVVNYMPAICLTSQVVKPELELTKVAPKRADRCNVIELEYIVKNGGSGDVGPLVVTDTLGKGLSTIEGGSTLTFQVDGLAAGDSRRFVARVYATKPGSFSSRAIAKAQNSELTSRSKETTTEVIAADLAVEVNGPNRLYGEQLARFTGRVINTGNAAAEDVRVNVFWPEACNMVDISAPTIESSNRLPSKSKQQEQEEPTLSKNAGIANSDTKEKSDANDGDSDKIELAMTDKAFTIGRLEAGQTAVFEYAIRTGDVETLPTKVVARHVCTVDAAVDKANAKSEAVAMAMARADVVRFAAMQMVVLDDQDPVTSKSNVVYSIRVWNEGDANDSNVTMRAELPKGLEFVSANGPTEHSVDGSTVTFKPIKTMEPGARVDYKVIAKSTGDGDVRFTAMLNSKSLKKAVIGEESTRLFAQDAK